MATSTYLDHSAIMLFFRKTLSAFLRLVLSMLPRGMRCGTFKAALGCLGDVFPEDLGSVFSYSFLRLQPSWQQKVHSEVLGCLAQQSRGNMAMLAKSTLDVYLAEVDLESGKPLLSTDSYVVYASSEDCHYVPIIFGTNAHKIKDWTSQEPFSTLAKNVISTKKTLLGYDRLLTLYHAISTAYSDHTSGGLGAVAEVGVYKGGSLYFIQSVLQDMGLHDIQLYGFDTFEGHKAEDITSEVEIKHKPGTFGDTSFLQVSEYLSSFNSIQLFQGRIQDTAFHVENEDFSVVHIDVDLYQVTKMALDFFSPRVRVGGIIILDDYGFRTTLGIEKVAQEFVAANKGWRLVPLLTGQGLLLRFTSFEEATTPRERRISV